MIVSPYTNDINKIITILSLCRNTAYKNGDIKQGEFFDTVQSIVIEWKYDNSQWDFRQNHYRQAVSFLMRLAEETPDNEYPEYFESRFFDTLNNYKALKQRYNERVGDNQ